MSPLIGTTLATSLDPLGQLWNKIGWPGKLYQHDRFPLAELGFCYLAGSNEVGLLYTDRRTGEKGMLTDDVQSYPSDVLVASFMLLVGGVDELVEQVKQEQADRDRRYEQYRAREERRRRRYR